MKIHNILFPLSLGLVFSQGWSQVIPSRGGLFGSGLFGTNANSGPALTIRPFAQVTAIYDHTYRPPTLDLSGGLPGYSSYGYSATVGLEGAKAWRRSILSIDYRTRYRQYIHRGALDGFDHILGLNYSRQLSRRVSLSFSEAGGSYARNVGLGGTAGIGIFGLNAPLYTDPTLDAIPDNDLVDTRTYFASSGANLNFQKSARLSFNASGTGFLVRRKASGLVDVNGFSTHGNAMYLLTRRQSIGVDYGFTRFDFHRAFGSSVVHIPAFNWAIQLTRRTSLGVQVGIYRLESERIVTIALDPLIAAILGRRAGLEVFHAVTYSSAYGVVLTRSFRRSQLSLVGRRGIVPGNGLYLTTRRDMVSVGYSYFGPRRWSLGLGAGYYRGSAQLQVAPILQTYQARAGFGYRIANYLHFTAAGSGRRSEISATSRWNAAQVSIGLAFSPGETALPIW